jgi:hypothetical protein
MLNARFLGEEWRAWAPTRGLGLWSRGQPAELVIGQRAPAAGHLWLALQLDAQTLL